MPVENFLHAIVISRDELSKTKSAKNIQFSFLISYIDLNFFHHFRYTPLVDTAAAAAAPVLLEVDLTGVVTKARIYITKW